MLTSTARVIAIISVVLAGVFIVLAHRRRPDLPASEIALSVYFTDPTRALMTSAYAAIAAALLSTAFLLALNMRAALFVAVVACCVGAALLIPVVATTQRNAAVMRSEAIRCVHRYSATAAFLAVGVAMAVSAWSAIGDANVLVAIPAVIGTVLVSQVIRNNLNPPHGRRQRLLFVALGVWIVAIAITG